MSYGTAGLISGSKRPSRGLLRAEILTTLPDPSPALIEALWEAGEYAGRRLTVSEQVELARELAKEPRGEITRPRIKAAFSRLKLREPSDRYTHAILTRLQKIRWDKSLFDLLIEYRAFAIRALSTQFGGKTRGHEEELRNNLLTFLQPRGYTEARSGRGRTDILIPGPPCPRLIEVKVWGGTGLYNDGLEELARYIHTERPCEAYLVVFGDREPLPTILADHRQAVAEERDLEGLAVPVVVVPFEVDAPSKAGLNSRRRISGGR